MLGEQGVLSAKLLRGHNCYTASSRSSHTIHYSPRKDPMPRLRSRSLLIALVSLTLLAGAGAPAIAQDATPAPGGVTILGPDESFGGATLGEWEARQWQWTVSFPPKINPEIDVAGPGCGYGQSGPVFFLPGNFTPNPTNMTCVVPEGVAILVTLGGSECSTVEPPPFFGRDEAELAACATATNDVNPIPIAAITVTINGQEVPNLESYRSVSPAFPLTFSEENVFGVPAGVALSVSDGYGFLIAPPAPGAYDLVISSDVDQDGEPFVSTYHLIVEAPQVIEPQATPGASPEAATPVA